MERYPHPQMLILLPLPIPEPGHLQKTQATAWNVTQDLIRRIEIKPHHLNGLESQTDGVCRIYTILLTLFESTRKEGPIMTRWLSYSKIEIDIRHI